MLARVRKALSNVSHHEKRDDTHPHVSESQARPTAVDSQAQVKPLEISQAADVTPTSELP
jgi:hypothetical protein